MGNLLTLGPECGGAQVSVNRIYLIDKFIYLEFMQIAALQTLTLIAQEKSFSRTAQLRNMTLSAVSMQMKSLEDSLGVTLFDRAFRPPKLTPLGLQIAQDAAQITQTQAVMQARCLDTEALTGALRIGFVPSTAARILPEFLGIAAQAAPDAQLQLTTGLSEHLCAQVRDGQLDAALVTEITDATYDLHTSPLSQEEMIVAAPPDADAQNLIDLSKSLPFLHFVPSSGIGKLIARYGRDMALQPRRVTTLDSIEVIVRCVRAGLGYSLLPEPDVRRYGGDTVRVYPCAPQRLYRTISLATRDDAIAATWRPKLLEILRDSL